MNIKMAIFWIAVAMNIFDVEAGEIPSTQASRETYLYCNVYLGAACFGIGSGDELQMTIPMDFVKYKLKLASGLIATVYVGNAPDVHDRSMAEKFSNCMETDKACSFVEVKKRNSTAEAIYSGGRLDDSVHVSMSGINSSNLRAGLEFIQNFRPCKRSGSSLICRDVEIFQEQRGRR